MRDIYTGQIVDYSDPECEFIKEFDHEIRKYGAVVYNQEYNTYQFIKSFSQIDYKRELLPDLIKVENADPRLKGLQLTIHYEFDPETEEDPDNQKLWEQMAQTKLPVYKYDDEGELQIDHLIALDVTPSVHIVWFLNPDSYDFILDTDLLMLDPIIKNIHIATKLIKDFGQHPTSALYDEEDLASYQPPVLQGVSGSPHHHHHDEDDEDDDDEDDEEDAVEEETEDDDDDYPEENQQ